MLQGHELVFVDSSDDARTRLENERFGLVMLGVHVDESQMFSLLGDIRSHAKYRQVPILCVLGSGAACFPRSRATGERIGPPGAERRVARQET